MTTVDSFGRSSVSTPARATAISSSFANRASPSVQPASKAYEPHLRAVLSKKFVSNVLGGAGIASWFISVTWITWQQSTPGSIGLFRWVVNSLSPLSVFYAFLLWMVAAVPIAVVRKYYLNTPNTTYLSPRETLLKRVFERAYRETYLVLLSSAFTLAIFYSLFSGMHSSRNDPKLGLWAGSKKHPLHINGRFLFIILSQVSGATLYFAREALRSRLHLQVTKQPELNIWPLLSSYSISSTLSSLVLSSLTTFISLVSFGVLRSIFLPVVYRLPIVHAFLRPFIAHFLRPTLTVTLFWSNFDLIGRSFTLAFLSMMMWDVTSTLFEHYFSAPVAIALNSRDSGALLASGICSTDPYFLLHVYTELCEATSDDDLLKRAAIFNDSSHNPSLSTTVIRQCLLLLGKDYQVLLNRGNASSTSPAVSQPAQKTPDDLGKSTANIIRGSVYKNTHNNPLDTLAESLSSESPMTKSLIDTTGNTIGISNVLQATCDMSANAIKSASYKETENLINLARIIKSWFSLAHYRSLQPLYIWWARERMDKAVQRALPNRELDIMIINALSSLVAKSLDNDILGHVQKDIPRVLEALVLLLIELEKLQTEALATYGVKKPNSQGASSENDVYNSSEVAAANEWIGGVKSVLQTGIVYIINTFGDRLGSFRFPAQIALRLQKFIDVTS